MDACHRHWRSIPLCIPLRFQMGRRPIHSLAHGIPVRTTYILYPSIPNLSCSYRLTFQIIMIIIYPTVIQPLFNKLSPLPAGELRSRTEAGRVGMSFGRPGHDADEELEATVDRTRTLIPFRQPFASIRRSNPLGTKLTFRRRFHHRFKPSRIRAQQGLYAVSRISFCDGQQ